MPSYERLHPVNVLVGPKRDLQKTFLCFLMLLVNHLECGADVSLRDQALELMKSSRLIDGHNDLPLKLRWYYQNKLSKVDLRTLSTTGTNIQKLTAGHVGAQFWSVYVLCSAQNKDVVRLTLEQIDVVKRMCKSYEEFELVTTAQGIKNIPNNKIACLIGIEGGHSIDSSLSALRMYYELGVRYMGLTHTCNTPWAETSSKQVHNFYPGTKGLTAFGKEVVKEMNRLGMMIDLSHASDATARAVLSTSTAPVIFSHSSAFSVCNHSRNVPNDILRRLKKNNGIIMVSFSTTMLACGDQRVSISTVADHFDHIKKMAGSKAIGIGSDYEGANQFPEGLEDVSKYPALIEELLRRGWNNAELRGVLRDNILRVLKEVEKVQERSSAMNVSEEEIPPEKTMHACRLDLRRAPAVASHGAPFWGQLKSVIVTLGVFLVLH
ncbi:dipeptidase 2-like [Eublepharis macularius]|uniref:Dipeptidase n=1 Tax=Eublepharis macularius TaxID=481883 RepID=A0AA97KHW1_EUBMA|nr:dipeptidase 2-like [Eublepharis macularius]